MLEVQKKEFNLNDNESLSNTQLDCKIELYREGMRWRGRLLDFFSCSQSFDCLDENGERHYWTYLPQWDELKIGNGSCRR